MRKRTRARTLRCDGRMRLALRLCLEEEEAAVGLLAVLRESAVDVEPSASAADHWIVHREVRIEAVIEIGRGELLVLESD